MMCARKNKQFLFITTLAFFLLAGCQSSFVEKEEGAEIIPVKVKRIELRELEDTIDYVGNIRAEEEVIVYPKVSGKISQKLKEDADAVTKGEAVAYIDRDEVGLTFEPAPVESPLSGVVGRIYVDKGTQVTPQTPIALVVNMNTVTIQLDIPEKYLPRVSIGQEAKISVDAYPQDVFIGKVTKVSPVIDMPTRSAPIEITIENQDYRLKSGMFARVRLILEKRVSVPVILKEAIVGKNAHQFVYVIENNKAILREVQLGIRQGPYYEVKAGLRPNDLVVIMGQQRLYEGVEVIIEE